MSISMELDNSPHGQSAQAAVAITGLLGIFGSVMAGPTVGIMVGVATKCIMLGILAGLGAVGLGIALTMLLMLLVIHVIHVIKD